MKGWGSSSRKVTKLQLVEEILKKAADGGKRDVFASLIPRYPADEDIMVFVQIVPREMLNALSLLTDRCAFDIKTSATGVWLW